MEDIKSEQASYILVQKAGDKVYLCPPCLVESRLERDLEIENVKKETSLHTNSDLRKSLIAMYRIQYINGALQVEQIDLDLIR